MDTQINPLFSVKIEELIPKGQTIISIPSSSSVQDALQVLVKHNIYSAPVGEDNVYSGFIDLVDIVTAIISSIETMITSKQSMQELIAIADTLQINKEVKELATKSPIYYIGKNQTLSDAIKVFASTGSRRLLVVENSSDTRNPTNVLTQSSVNTYLSKHLEQLGDLGKKTIQEESLGLKTVMSIDLNAPAIEAFKMIAEHRITGVAVLEEDKTLLTIISAKDIKEADLTPPFRSLFLTAVQFVTLIRSKLLKESVPVVYVKPEATIADVIHRLAFLKLHRMFVADAEKFPVGVISMSTIINYLAKFV